MKLAAAIKRKWNPAYSNNASYFSRSLLDQGKPAVLI